MANLTVDLSVRDIVEITELMYLLTQARAQSDALYAELQAAQAELAALRADATAAHPA